MADSEVSDAATADCDQKAQGEDGGDSSKLIDDKALRISHGEGNEKKALQMVEGVEPYYITRKKDDLIIAVWQDSQQKVLPSNEKLVDPDFSDSDDEMEALLFDNLPDPRTVTLSHQSGDEFIIPWALCAKWRWMQEVIILTYGANNAAKDSIANGRFKIYQDGKIILVEKWHMLAKPWMRLSIKLNEEEIVAHRPSSHPPSLLPSSSCPPSSNPPSAHPPSPRIEPDLSTIPGASIRYKFDFWVRETNGRPSFSKTEVYDVPMAIEKEFLGDEEGVVLEEMNKIIHSKHHEEVTFEGTNRGAKRKGPRRDDLKNSFTLEERDSIELKKLHVKSVLLLNALRSVAKYTSRSRNESETFTNGIFEFPFQELYHHMDALQAYKKQTTAPRCNHSVEDNAACDRHIDILLDYLYAEPTVQLRSVQEKWKQKAPTTTFTAFWLLIKPGTDVYVMDNGQLNAYVVDEVSGGSNYDFWKFSATSYCVRVWSLIFNGKVITRWERRIYIPVFEGERHITSLPLFPTSFQDNLDGGALRKQLIERGSKFLQFAKKPTYLEYTGVGMKTGGKKYNRARVVVEHETQPWSSGNWGLSPWTFGSDQSTSGLGPARVARCECSKCAVVNSREGSKMFPIFSDYDKIDANREEGLSDHQLLLCMSHMFGFILKDRTYDILDLNGLSQPTLNETALDDLVLRPEKNKETIKSIVSTYTDSESQADLFSVDFIRGKGEGQIFLLHGPPGTGKTLTAESVAEYTRRPLLSITAADLGHSPTDLEKNLLRFFDNATAWGAVVLLDEADVYLERRSTNDLQRNSIVSIFLRALDYFEGILFFTTNRVGQFDEAFMSRIHVAIGYDALDKDARDQIWDAFFRKLKETAKRGGPRIESEYEAKEYVRKSEEVKSLDWNGRQIRNAFQTAVALAIADSKAAKAKGRPEDECVPLLTEAHLRQVVHMSGAFKNYIKATHEGMSESDRAFLFGNRHDQPLPRN